MALSPGSGGGQTIPPTIIDNELTAPLELPAEPGKPLTTQGGNTLDDGSGSATVADLTIPFATGYSVTTPESWTSVSGEGSVEGAVVYTNPAGQLAFYMEGDSGNYVPIGDIESKTNNDYGIKLRLDVRPEANNSGLRGLVGGPQWYILGNNNGTLWIGPGSDASGNFSASTVFADALNTSGDAAVGGSVQLGGAGALSSGSGVPAIAGAVGDYYFRTDATTTADERIYVCTVAGAAGSATWVGIV